MKNEALPSSSWVTTSKLKGRISKLLRLGFITQISRCLKDPALEAHCLPNLYLMILSDLDKRLSAKEMSKYALIQT